MTDLRVEELRQKGLAKIRENQPDESITFFDQALAIATDEEARELLTINKASAMITLGQNGTEVQQLPRIIMRRRNLRHLYVAAYNLRWKFTLEKDFKKASFYARIALEAAEEAGEITWKAEVLNAMGNIAVFDSNIDEGARYYEQALELFEPTDENALRRGVALQSLGYCRLQQDEIEAGIDLIHEAMPLLQRVGAAGYVAESHIDLCYAFLQLGQYETARHHGELGLAGALETRQMRNVHYLLGEVAHNCGDLDRAELHFEHLAKHYPDFPALKNLLIAFDLTKIVNFKL